MLGDFTPGKTIRFKFNTHTATGTPITLAGTPALSVYKDGGTTESTAGVTLTVDFDARTGFHDVAINTAADGTFYSAGSDFQVVITTGTVDSINVAGTVVGSFSLSNRSALRPTTADRTLGVDASGNITLADGSLTTAKLGAFVLAKTTNITGFNDPTSADSASAVWGAATRTLTAFGFNVTLADGSLTTAKLGTFALAKGTNITGFNDLSAAQVNAEADTALADVGLTSTVTSRIDVTVSSRLSAGSYVAPDNVGIAVAESVAIKLGSALELDGAVYRYTANALELAPTGGGGPTAAQIADAVWDEPIADHLTAGSTGARLNAAGSAGDPWATTGLGSYPAGSAGKLLFDKPDVSDIMEFTIGGEQLQNLIHDISAFLTAKTTGGGTSTVAFRDLADGYNRLVFTLDTVNNRIAVVRNRS